MEQSAVTDRLLLIINPISGSGAGAKIADRLHQAFEYEGFDTQVCLTAHAGHATELALEAVESGVVGVVACGGDGTINETARALCGTGVPLGILPLGSGNGLARHVGLPMDPLAAVPVIARRHVQQCDYGTANGEPFFCTFGMGFDAAVSDRFAGAGQRGLKTYVRSALDEFVRYSPTTYTVTADGESITDRAYILAVCNACQYGNNTFIAPHASITDGYLDLVIIKAMPKPKLALTALDIMAGTLDNSRDVIVRRARHIVIDRPAPAPAHRDGEPFTTGTHVNVECHAGQLAMFTSPDKSGFTPFVTPLKSLMSDIYHSMLK